MKSGVLISKSGLPISFFPRALEDSPRASRGRQTRRRLVRVVWRLDLLGSVATISAPHLPTARRSRGDRPTKYVATISALHLPTAASCADFGDSGAYCAHGAFKWGNKPEVIMPTFRRRVWRPRLARGCFPYGRSVLQHSSLRGFKYSLDDLKAIRYNCKKESLFGNNLSEKREEIFHF